LPLSYISVSIRFAQTSAPGRIFSPNLPIPPLAGLTSARSSKNAPARLAPSHVTTHNIISLAAGNIGLLFGFLAPCFLLTPAVFSPPLVVACFPFRGPRFGPHPSIDLQIHCKTKLACLVPFPCKALQILVPSPLPAGTPPGFLCLHPFHIFCVPRTTPVLFLLNPLITICADTPTYEPHSR